MATATKTRPAASGAKKHLTEVAPNAAKTLTALREMGYGSFDAVLDIIDNSIDAGATKVAVTIREAGKDVVIDIRDNGNGMDERVLTEALRLGSDTEHDAKVDLGKFGMGLVTASISLARNVYVLTRQKGQTAYEATFDLDDIARENKFVITLHPAVKSDRVLDLIGDQGTLVRLSRIDRIADSNPTRFGQNLRLRIGQVYRHFLEKGVSVVVNNRAVKKIDPLMLDHELTQVVLDQDLRLESGTAHLKVVQLPELGQAGDLEANITPHNSGFYVVRNNREIMEAQTFGFYQRHHSYSRFRAELSFNGSLDAEFHVDIRKGSIHPGDKLLERLKDKTAKLIAESGRRGREDSEAPVKLSHGAADLINAKLAPPAPPAKKGKHEAVAAPLVQPATEEKAKAVKAKAGKGKLDIIEQDKPAAVEPEAPTAAVEFKEADMGDTGRFFSSEVKQGGQQVTVTYNTRHPFIRMVADVRSKQAHGLVDLLTFALARAEADVDGGNKVVNKACDYLKALSTPAATGG